MSFGKQKDNTFVNKKPSQAKVPQTVRNPNRRQSEEEKRPKTDRNNSKKGGKAKPLGTFRPTPLSGP